MVEMQNVVQNVKVEIPSRNVVIDPSESRGKVRERPWKSKGFPDYIADWTP